MMSERRWGNFSSCCRLCLSEKLGTLKSIFEDASRTQQIVKNIRICLGVEIQTNDKLSTMICEQCLSKVNGWSNYRKYCHTNQSKLTSWFNLWSSSNLGDVTIQIKDEVVDGITDDLVGEDDDVVQVKTEPRENFEPELVEDDIDDLPPPLTPHPPDEECSGYFNNSDDDDTDNQEDISSSPIIIEEVSSLNGLMNNSNISDLEQNDDGRNCRICDKVFSTPGNRRKHENIIHRIKENSVGTPTEIDDSNDADQINNTNINDLPSDMNDDSEIEKIQFAAGLKLQQRSAPAPTPSDQIPFENMPLTKVEISYLEKCKVIIRMTETLSCACHNETFEDLKDLFAHLKKQRSWFAMFTCYNCLITFGDRSSYMKHYCHCPKDLLQNLKRLAESPVDPEVKLRLYQSYKCVKCSCIFSFIEDYCSHFEEEHTDMLENPPFECMCSDTFNDAEDFKSHVQVCQNFLKYFCDICFGVFTTTDMFKKHCEKEHDYAEGNTLDSYDSFHKCKLLLSQDNLIPANSSKRSLPDNDIDEDVVIIKRRRTVNMPLIAPQLECEDPNYSEGPKLGSTIKYTHPTGCPACDKIYSSYHNMLRHYKHSHDKSGKILTCQQCSERFRLVSELKEHEEVVHNIVNDNHTTNSDQFKFSCPDCGDLFKSLEEWKKHIEKHPKKACGECEKQFTLQSELDQHRSAHLNIKVYRDAKTKDYKSTMISPTLICAICDKTFASKSELRQHNLLHEKMPVLSANDGMEQEEKKEVTRRYCCSYCEKNFVTYKELWYHNKKFHADKNTAPEEYPQNCDECGKVLSSKGAWVNHKRMHERLGALQQVSNNVQALLPNRGQKLRVAATTTRDEDSESYYTCKKCFKVFSSKSNHRNHMKSHGIVLNPNSRSSSKTGKIIKTFWCDVCHQACPGFAELQDHKREHINEKVPKLTNETEQNDQIKPFIFTCNLCTLTFSTNFALRRHKEKHILEESMKEAAKQVIVYCKYCKIAFPGVDKLNEHMAEEHDEAVAKSKQLQAQNSSKRFPCKLCKKVFDNAGALSSHQGWHKRGKYGKKILRSQERVVRTMLKQMPQSHASTESNNRYKCYTCPEHFATDTALQIHILAVHRNVNATVLHLKCSYCKLSFETRSAYDAHMQLHQVVKHKKSPKPHPCKYCTAGFSRSDTLNAHIRQHHKDHYDDIYKCNQCDRVFDKQNALTIHLKVHDKQRLSGNPTPKPIPTKNIYFCSICDVGFAIAKDLRNHVITAHPF